MNVVHFVTDEKFIDDTIALADATSYCHEFYALEPVAPVAQWTYVQQKARIQELHRNSPEMEALLDRHETLFVLHSRDRKMERFCRNLAHRKACHNAILWCPWGHDYATLIDPNTIAPETQKLRANYEPKGPSFFSRLSRAIKLRLFLRKIDFYTPRLPAEKDKFRAILRRGAQEVAGRWSYYVNIPSVKTANPFIAPKADGTAPIIMFNHSGLWECNHLDGFRQILPFIKPSQEILVPLSYGIAKSVVKQVLIKQNSNHSAQLKFLSQWQTKEEWWETINTCDIFVHTAWRQIANGATTAALLFGKKVFLSERNPFFSYYRAMGIRVFSLERELTADAFSEPLTDTVAQQNMARMRELFPTRARQIEDAQTMFDFIAERLSR